MVVDSNSFFTQRASRIGRRCAVCASVGAIGVFGCAAAFAAHIDVNLGAQTAILRLWQLW